MNGYYLRFKVSHNHPDRELLILPMNVWVIHNKLLSDPNFNSSTGFFSPSVVGNNLKLGPTVIKYVVFWSGFHHVIGPILKRRRKCISNRVILWAIREIDNIGGFFPEHEIVLNLVDEGEILQEFLRMYPYRWSPVTKIIELVALEDIDRYWWKYNKLVYLNDE